MTPLTPLEDMGKYATVVVDPPWPYQPLNWHNVVRTHGTNGKYQNHLPYDSLSIVDIQQLPVPDVMAEDSWLFLWTAQRFVHEALHCIEHWGLEYRFMMTWIKNNGHQLPGSPSYNNEFTVVARRGKPVFIDTRAFATANYWPRSAHSVKPEGFYDLLRRVTPIPRLDVFGRRRIAGFDSWGNEAPSGITLPDHYQTVMEGVDG